MSGIKILFLVLALKAIGAFDGGKLILDSNSFWVFGLNLIVLSFGVHAFCIVCGIKLSEIFAEVFSRLLKTSRVLVNMLLCLGGLGCNFNSRLGHQRF